MSTFNNSVDNLIRQYGYFVFIANQKLNLVSRKSNLQDINIQIEEAILPLSWDSCNINSPILDIGTGAGFPGIPIKLAKNSTEITLLDSNRRKCMFLASTISQLKLSGTLVVNERAEAFVNNIDNHDKFMTLVTRGVGVVSSMLGWAEKLLQSQGELILWKGESIREELVEINQTIWEPPQYLACKSKLLLVRLVRK